MHCVMWHSHMSNECSLFLITCNTQAAQRYTTTDRFDGDFSVKSRSPDLLLTNDACFDYLPTTDEYVGQWFYIGTLK